MVTFNATIADECAAFDQAARAAYKARLLATLPSVDIYDIYLRVTCGSVFVEAFIVTASVAAAADVQEKLATVLSSAGASSVLGVTVMDMSPVAYGTVPDVLVGGGGTAADDSRSSNDGGNSMLVLVGVAIATLFCALLCMSCILLGRRRAAEAKRGQAVAMAAAKHGRGF